jgi:uncharacterized protein
MENNVTSLAEIRREKEEFFAHHPQSPLTAEQKKHFTGLSYFNEDPNLRLEIEVQPFDQQDEIEMQTSTGEIQTYRRFGRVRFSIHGQPVELTIYSNEYGYFLPFVDSLAGTETYPAGRYLEPEPLAGGKFLVDFNLAYNPYCAYNDLWSCPLTPFENRLKAAVTAGEKLPADEWSKPH